MDTLDISQNLDPCLHAGGCEVFLDVLDVDSIKDMGVYSWVQEKVELARYVIVVCSTGARVKCARNRKGQMKQQREVRCAQQRLMSCARK